MKQLFFLFFFSFPLTLCAQNAQQLDSIAQDFRDKGDYENALEYAKKTIAAHQRNAELDTNLIQYFNSAGEICSDKGDYEAAVKYLKTALKQSKGIHGKQSIPYAQQLNSLSSPYIGLRDFEKAEELQLAAKKIYQELDLDLNSKDYRTLIINIASRYLMKGELEAAAPLYLSILENIQSHKEDDLEGYYLVLNDYGILLTKMNKYATALDLLDEALLLQEKRFGKTTARYAEALNNLSYCYQQAGELNTAKGYLEQALNIQKQTLGDKSKEHLNSLFNYGALHYNSGDLKQAEKILIDCRAKVKQYLGNQHSLYESASNALSAVYFSLQDFDKAKELLLEAIEISAASNPLSSPNHILLLNNASFLHNRLKDYKAAYTYAIQATQFNILDSVNLEGKELTPEFIQSLTNYTYRSPFSTINSLSAFCLISRSQYEDSKDEKQLEHLLQFTETANQIIQQFYRSFGLEADKISMLNNNARFIRFALEACAISQKSQFQFPQLEEKAFRLAELNKANLLATSLKSTKARKFGGLTDELEKKELALEKQQKELQSLLLQSNIKKKEQEDLLSQLNQLNLEIENFREELEAKHPKYYDYKYSKNEINLKTIQKTLNEETAILEMSVSKKLTHLVLVKKNRVIYQTIEISQQELSERAKALRNALSDYELIKNKPQQAFQDYTREAFWFYDQFLDSILNKTKGIKKLIIIPDGEFSQLPFEAFLTAEVKEELSYDQLPYFLHDYQISYNYAAALWKDNLKKKLGENNGKMLAAAAAYGNEVNSNSRNIDVKAFRSNELFNIRKNLTALPAVKSEVEALSQLFNGDFWTDFQANEKSFKEEAQAYGMIHLAMHGLLNSESPILSSLAFTEDGDSIEDNFLQAYEISGMDLKADLVVLSACETGYGKFQQGEGVMSLARSFMYAGVPSLVVSLWQVNDASTALIMDQFYQKLLAGDNKALALQTAKQQYIEMAKSDNPIAAHPAFWAPFIQLGDSRALPIQSNTGIRAQLWWILPIGILMLAGFIYILLGRRKA